MRPALLLPALLATAAWPLGTRAQEGPNPSFNLVNRGRTVITEVYATPSSTDRWGRDRLQNSTLPPGRTFPVRLPADGNCLYDIRVVYAGRPPEESRRVDTCALDSIGYPGAQPGTAASPPANTSQPRDNPAPPRQPGADDPSFRLVNRGQAEIQEVYASPSGEDDWGPDQLGDDTVRAGRTRVVRLPTGQCTWDVRVIFADGTNFERRRLDLCKLTDLRVP